MKPARRTTWLNNQVLGKSVSGAQTALLFTPPNRMSHCYIAAGIAKINRQPRRLEITVSHTKQTPAVQIDRQHCGTLHGQSRCANSSHSPQTTSRCLFHQRAGFADKRSRVAHNGSRLSRRTCQGAKKQQIRRSLQNSLGLYFLASYVQFPIGRQRALMHNRGTKVAAGYNDKKRTALVRMEPSREHQSVAR
jgi:hypothetical protein